MLKFTIVPFINYSSYGSISHNCIKKNPIDPSSEVVIWGSNLDECDFGPNLPENFGKFIPDTCFKHIVLSWGREFASNCSPNGLNVDRLYKTGKSQSASIMKKPNAFDYDVNSDPFVIIGATAESVFCSLRCFPKFAGRESVGAVEFARVRGYSGMGFIHSAIPTIQSFNSGKNKAINWENASTLQRVARIYTELQDKSRQDFEHFSDFLSATPNIKNVVIMADMEAFGPIGLTGSKYDCSRYARGIPQSAFFGAYPHYLVDYADCAKRMGEKHPNVKFMLIDAFDGNGAPNTVTRWSDNIYLGSLKTYFEKEKDSFHLPEISIK